MASLGVDDPFIVGYAAYCLELLGAECGTHLAQERIREFQCDEALTFNKRFALNALIDYVSAFD